MNSSGSDRGNLSCDCADTFCGSILYLHNQKAQISLWTEISCFDDLGKQELTGFCKTQIETYFRLRGPEHKKVYCRPTGIAKMRGFLLFRGLMRKKFLRDPMDVRVSLLMCSDKKNINFENQKSCKKIKKRLTFVHAPCILIKSVE